jgi:hypothetical protein
MTKHNFTDEETYAVYTVHGERCSLCREPIDLASIHVDHIIPEDLLDDPARLTRTLRLYGLPETFDLNSYANWMPACMRCNLRKGERVLNPAPIFLVELQVAAEKATRAAELAQERVAKQTITKAWNAIKRANPSVVLPSTVEEAVKVFALFHTPKREPEMAKEPIHLTPDIHVVEMRVVHGPYGTGMGLFGPGVSNAMRCSCGSTAYNGARCVMCGEMGDF